MRTSGGHAEGIDSTVAALSEITDIKGLAEEWRKLKAAIDRHNTDLAALEAARTEYRRDVEAVQRRETDATERETAVIDAEAANQATANDLAARAATLDDQRDDQARTATAQADRGRRLGDWDTELQGRATAADTRSAALDARAADIRRIAGSIAALAEQLDG